MQQHVTTEHQLQMRCLHRGESWYPPTAGMFRPAVVLAYQGRFVEALQAAEDIQIENYGAMEENEFRIVTTTRTVAVLGNIEGRHH